MKAEIAKLEPRAPSRLAPSFRGWLEGGFLVCLFLTTLVYGSAGIVPTAVAALGFAALTIASMAVPIASRRVRSVYGVATFVGAALWAWAYVQTWPVGSRSLLANPAWEMLDETLGGDRGFISVAPGVTWESLPALALPFLCFLSALRVFQGDEGAVRLWRALGLFGLGLAVFGLVQELAFPGRLLFETKKYYIGSLTATFINRNTAGTFFGLALVINASLAMHYLKSVRVRSLTRRTMEGDLSVHGPERKALLYGAFCVAIATALFLTQSRGAVGATFIGMALQFAISAMRPLTADRSNPEAPRGFYLRRLLAGVLLLAGVFAMFAERSIYRMEQVGESGSRWCVYQSILGALHDQMPWGAGFGAFEDVYRRYRQPECAGIGATWDRAHNVYLEGLLGLGAVFALAFSVGVAALTMTLIGGVRRRHRLRYIPVGGLAGLALVMTHSLVDFSLQIPGFAVYFAATMAAAATVSSVR